MDEHGGTDALESRDKLGVSDSDADFWGINLSEIKFGDSDSTTEVKAALASTFDFISVPDTIWQDITKNYLNSENGWHAVSANGIYDYYVSESNCENSVLTNFNNLTLTWKVDDSTTYDLLIKPDQYLMEAPTTGYCVCLLTYVSNSDYDMMLGTPFFRSYTIVLNYLEN